MPLPPPDPDDGSDGTPIVVPPMPGAWDLDRALAWLEGHVNMEGLAPNRVSAPSLEPMRELSALLGDPQHAAPVIHITGTNGKGSTARITSALLTAHALGVGLYTSPDLERINERIARHDQPIDDASLAEALAAIAAVEEMSGIHPSRFDILTLAAFRWFADIAVDVAVVEVGMAGRWDSTNVADATVAVVTNVDLDHTEVLGPTREHIAREKSGIVKPGSALVLGETDPDLLAVFEAAAPTELLLRERDYQVLENDVAVGGRVLAVRTPLAVYDELFVPLHGSHQGDNVAAAMVAVEAFFGRPTDPELLQRGLEAVTVPGRFEVVGRQPLVILDGAHNPAGANAAATTLDDFDVAGSRILVVGFSRGRDPVEMLEVLAEREVALVVACAASYPRAMPPAEVAAAAEEVGVEVVIARDVADALRKAGEAAGTDDLILVTGSLYVVGEARRSLGVSSRPADGAR
ncbi:MAG: Mur ligase family protein [Actinomycetota bacterium]|nr:Mur ligase family protein [Actinomycetota bacterium]